MKKTHMLDMRCKRPRVIGTGLIALDVVVRGDYDRPKLWTGGTCGNVLAILGYLGWDAVPIGRMKNDFAYRLIRKDLQTWGADLKFASLKPHANTPIVVQRIRRDTSGRPFHTFSFNCPGCGARLPQYKPVFSSSLTGIGDDSVKGQVFFLDRVSKAGLLMAEATAKNGALVFFEPSGVKDPVTFRKILSVAHVFKYSHERFRDLNESVSSVSPNLEVETLGSGGLRYRANLPRYKTGWIHLNAFPTHTFLDAAGAGDWCTSGILHVLGQDGVDSLMNSSLAKIHRALSLGQALAAWNCQFEGARGGMYSVSKKAFRRDITNIISGSQIEIPAAEHPTKSARHTFNTLCPSCSDHSGLTKLTGREHKDKPQLRRQRSA
jgi:sugar/nucleoside kinase (ribokinase family)